MKRKRELTFMTFSPLRSSRLSFFSIVIPLYNKEDDIIRTVGSVLAQDFQDFELIIVNDGSTDSSLDRVKTLKDSRIKLVDSLNQGVSAARNLGVYHSSSDYVCFLDADDFWESWHLSDLKSLIKNYPNCTLYSTSHKIVRGGEEYYANADIDKSESGILKDFFESFGSGLGLVNSSTACMPVKIVNKLSGFPEGVHRGEDVYLWIRAALIGSVAYSSNVSVLYNQDAGNRSNKVKTLDCPYYIKWLDGYLFSDAVDASVLKSAMLFLKRAIIFNSAGLRMEGNIDAVKKMKRLNMVRSSIILKAYFFVLSIIPAKMLKLLQHYRHAKK